MTTPSQMTGATIDVRTTTPSIHLFPIVKALTDLVSSNTYIQPYPFHNNRLLVDTKVIIEKLISEKILKDFNVVADLNELPKIHTSATLGGNLFDEPMALSRAIDKFHYQINQQLEKIPSELFENITLNNVQNYLTQLSKSMV